MYPLWSPPEGLGPLLSPEYRERPRKEARAFYKWFLTIIPERLEILCGYCEESIEGNPLEVLSRFGVKVVDRLRHAPEMLVYETTPLSPTVPQPFPTPHADALAEYDMGLLIAHLIMQKYPHLNWNLSNGSKLHFYHNLPVVSGFNLCRLFSPLFYSVHGGMFNPTAWREEYEALWDLAPEVP